MSDVTRGVDYLLGLGVASVRVALLRVLPGTVFWETHREVGLHFPETLPYYIDHTDWIGRDEIERFFGGHNHRVFSPGTKVRGHDHARI